MKPPIKLSRDIIAGGIILALTAFLWGVTTTFDSDPLGLEQGMPATYMPRLILAVIAGLAAIVIIKALTKKGEPIGKMPAWQMPATATFLALAAAMFPKLGVPIVFFIVCLVMPVMWGKKNYITVVIFAVSMPVAIYIIFKLILGLRLPMGPLSALGL